MSHLTDWVILRFEQIAPLTLKLYFADQTTQLIDFEPVLRGDWLKPLRDPEYFKQVRLNDVGNLEWPDGQDFNPEALHDWPAFEQSYIQDGQRIEQVKSSGHAVRAQHTRASEPRHRSQHSHPVKAGAE